MTQTVRSRFQQLLQTSDTRLVVPAGHVHQWERLPESAGISVCEDRRCLWCAVCPACLGSLDVALQVQAGIPGLALVWCSLHDGPHEGVH